MDEQLRYEKDKATVIAIIKYILYLLVAVALLYFATRLVLLIFPFLLGFILAKASRHVANGLFNMPGRLRARRLRKAEKDAVLLEKRPTFTRVQEKERHAVYKLLFPRRRKKFLSKRTKLAVVIYVFLLILTLGLLGTMTTLLVIQADRVIDFISKWDFQTDIIDVVTTHIDRLSVAQGGFLTADQMAQLHDYIYTARAEFVDKLPDYATAILSGIISVVGNLPLVLFAVVVVVMSGFYFLIDSKMVFTFLSRNIKSRSFRHKSIQLLDRLSASLFRVIGGYLFLIFLTFVQAFVVFGIAGVNYTVILALVAALLDLVPVVGISFVMIPVMIYLFVSGEYIGVLIIFLGLVLMTLFRRVIEPPVLGNAMHMHPMGTLFAMIVGIGIWGPVGFVLGPVVLLVSIEVFRVFSLDQKVRNFAGNMLNKLSEDAK